MTLARLETAVLQAGLSMPNRTADFEGVFVVGTSPQINLLTPLRNVISGWNKPVYLCEVAGTVGTTTYFKKMGLVYCLGSGIGVLEEGHEVADNDPIVLKLSAACPDNQVKVAMAASTTDGWVTFSGCQTPFVVREISNDRKQLGVMASNRDLIPFFAELQYLRAMCAYVISPGGTSPQFYIQDVTRGPAQPVMEGVSQVLFSFNENSNLFTVHLLVRGNRRFPGQVTSSVPGWPAAISDEDRHYRLVAMSASWRVRN
jgi:hypothetical protein